MKILIKIIVFGGLLILAVLYKFLFNDKMPIQENISNIAKSNITDVFQNNINNQNIIDGISLYNIQPIIVNKNINIQILKVNLSGALLEIKNPKTIVPTGSANYSGYTLNEYFDLGQFDVVISGGYLSSWSPPYPLGYLKINNKEYNRVHPSWLTRGLLCVNDQNVKIEAFENIKQTDGWSSCIQGGPILIQNKIYVLDQYSDKNKPTRTKIERQVFICKVKKNNLLVGLTDEISLNDLLASKFLTLPKEEGGLGCLDALALSGDKVAGMIMKTSKGEIIKYGNTDILLPTAIVIKSKP